MRRRHVHVVHAPPVGSPIPGRPVLTHTIGYQDSAWDRRSPERLSSPPTCSPPGRRAKDATLRDTVRLPSRQRAPKSRSGERRSQAPVSMHTSPPLSQPSLESEIADHRSPMSPSLYGGSGPTAPDRPSLPSRRQPYTRTPRPDPHDWLPGRCLGSPLSRAAIFASRVPPARQACQGCHAPRHSASSLPAAPRRAARESGVPRRQSPCTHHCPCPSPSHNLKSEITNPKSPMPQPSPQSEVANLKSQILNRPWRATL